MTEENLIQGLILAIVPLIVQAFKKKVWKKIPKTFIPISAAVVGVFLQYISSITIEGIDMSLVQGAFLGAGGSWLRDVLKGGQKDLKAIGDGEIKIYKNDPDT